MKMLPGFNGKNLRLLVFHEKSDDLFKALPGPMRDQGACCQTIVFEKLRVYTLNAFYLLD